MAISSIEICNFTLIGLLLISHNVFQNEVKTTFFIANGNSLNFPSTPQNSNFSSNI